MVTWTRRDIVIFVVVAALVVLVTVAGLVAARISIEERAAQSSVQRQLR